MTESEWFACADPAPMLDFLKGKVSNRKLRLFLVACARLFWNQIPDVTLRTGVEASDPRYDWPAMATEMRRAVEVGERYADGQALASEREMSSNQLGRLFCFMETTIHQIARMMGLTYNHFTAIFGLCYCTVLPRSGLNRLETSTHWQAGVLLSAQHQLPRLRDIFGNPFSSSPPIQHSVLTWNDATVRRIAESIYNERRMPEGTLDTSRLAILHDALLDAGCDNEELLTHLRSECQHYRGCWVIDLILGKE